MMGPDVPGPHLVRDMGHLGPGGRGCLRHRGSSRPGCPRAGRRGRSIPWAGRTICDLRCTGKRCVERLSCTTCTRATGAAPWRPPLGHTRQLEPALTCHRSGGRLAQRTMALLSLRQQHRFPARRGRPSSCATVICDVACRADAPQGASCPSSIEKPCLPPRLSRGLVVVLFDSGSHLVAQTASP